MTARVTVCARRPSWSALLLVALVGCSSLDPDVLETPGRPDASGSVGEGDAGPMGGAGGMVGPISGAGATGGTGGSGGEGGVGGTGGAGGAGGTSSTAGCTPNPNVDDEVCPEICPETCDGEDNDCDRRIDEGEADDECALANATAACSKGECVIVGCDGTWRDCDSDPATGCEAPEDDVDNCGTCGNQCVFVNAIPACMNGNCEPAGCIDLFVDCDSDPLECETPSNTLANCGECGLLCENVPNATADCTNGVCGPGQCADGYDDCDGDPATGCEQVLTALQHCGACRTPCDFASSTGDDCSSGVCVAGTCKVDFDDCDGLMTNGCESLASAANCGACGVTCDTALDNVATADCSTGSCVVNCATGFGDCDSNPLTGCEESIFSLARCGASCAPCSFDHALASCDTGICSFLQCDEGWDDCNDDLSDGCETSLDDNATCGSCDVACGGVTPYCSGGTCSGLDCTPGTADCNLMAGDGCEVNTTTDPSHCGSCPNACAFTTGTPHGTGPVCVNSQCEVVCGPLYDDCNADYADGCEQSLETLTTCGGCATTCAIPNADETCVGGTCAVDNCETDRGDCDADPLTCETPLDTLSDCGACDTACNQTNANVECGGDPGAHGCQILSCTQTYYGNCDGLASTGCESDKRSDASNCGTCGFNCNLQDNVQSAMCSASSCNFTCDGGFGDCNGMDNDGCEQGLNTLQHCTGCGTPCSRTNGTASCASGSCQLTGCNAGYQNCDGNATNGCEPLNTLADCGNCGASCNVANGTGDCSNMACEVASCDANWDDCDGDVGNGCEHDSRAPGSGGLGPCFPDPTGCTKIDYDGQSYYFCTTDSNWTSARDKCRLLFGTELVRIDDSLENAFVLSYIVAESWIGANDRTVEGEWRWVETGTDAGDQFWQGDSTGGQVGGLFYTWTPGEPTGGVASNCGRMVLDGTWRDIDCAGVYDYVCEQAADLCPSDPDKLVPGTCGCGVADDDTDLDGTADCNDGCPTDMSKTAAGLCGCNVSDLDSDTDGTPDCNDQCPSNPAKTVAPCSWLPDNYVPDLYPHTAVVNFNCGGTHTFDSTTGAWDTTCCGTCPAVSSPVAQTTGGTLQVRVLSMAGLSVASGTTIRLVGDHGVVFSVDQDATIGGTINAGAIGTSTKGAGAHTDCPDRGLGHGGNGSNIFVDFSSGAGAGYVGSGGDGGDGCFGLGGGDPGDAHGSATLTPLKGGCYGGDGGAGGTGGRGGGAVQLAVQGDLTIASSGIISAGSGGGGSGTTGGGGGSGGGILLNYGGTYSNAGALRAHGGGGGARNSSGAGQDGHLGDDSRASGGSSSGLGGTNCEGSACTASDAGATGVGYCSGGGGGAAGRIVVSAK